MKKILIVAISAMFSLGMCAQSDQTAQPQQTVTESLTDAQLSKKFKMQMDVAKSEISTLKKQAKLEKGDVARSAEIASQLETKKAELSELKRKKGIVDASIKANKAKEKALKAAEKAQKKAEKAAAKAASLR